MQLWITHTHKNALLNIFHIVRKRNRVERGVMAVALSRGVLAKTQRRRLNTHFRLRVALCLLSRERARFNDRLSTF